MPFLKLKALTPQHMPTSKDYWRAIEAAYRRTTGLVEKDLRSTTRTWDHQPKFRIETQTKGGNYSLTAGTDDKRYLWIDEGTGIYGPTGQTIKPKRSKYFRFQVGGRLKTRPNVIGSYSGSPHTDWVTVTEIKGIPKRNFIRKIQSRRQIT